jgi:hypothetical protein
MAGPEPLKGLKVVELARILAGPWAGQTLADLGCEIIKVGSPAGDDTRQWARHMMLDLPGGRQGRAHANQFNGKPVFADEASPTLGNANSTFAKASGRPPKQ